MGGFYPSLFYNVMMNKVSSRNWFDRVDENIIVGALPFKGDVEKLMKQENVKAVVSLCQGYEHKKFVAGKEDWEKAGVDYINLPTIDYSSPSTEDIEKGIEFIQKHADQDETVYVHCKAGRTRSVTLVGCYLIHKKKWTPSNSKSYLEEKRPHVVLQDLHFRAMYRFYDKVVKPKHDKAAKAKQKTGKEGGSQEDLGAASGGEDGAEGERQEENGEVREDQEAGEAGADMSRGEREEDKDNVDQKQEDDTSAGDDKRGADDPEKEEEK